jgi:steroid delta-isomerase-like uncharacterized protein
MSADPKVRIRQLCEEVWSKGSLAILDELFAPDFICHDPALAAGGSGRKEFKQLVMATRTAFPDLQVVPEAMAAAEGEQVVTRWIVRGTHKGEFLGIAPTGQPITMTGIFIDRFVGDRIAEHWVQRDSLGLVQRLGATLLARQPK